MRSDGRIVGRRRRAPSSSINRRSRLVMVHRAALLRRRRPPPQIVLRSAIFLIRKGPLRPPAGSAAPARRGTARGPWGDPALAGRPGLGLRLAGRRRRYDRRRRAGDARGHRIPKH